MPIMIKRLLHIALIFIAVLNFAHDSTAQTEKKWGEERKKLKYNKADKYKGPDEWQGTDPTNMKNRQFTPIFGSGPGGVSSGRSSSGQGSGGQPIYSGGSGGNGGYQQGSSGSGSPGGSAGSGGGSGYQRSGSQGARYNPQQIQRDRQKRYSGFDRGSGKGPTKYNPKVQRPKPVKTNPSTKKSKAKSDKASTSKEGKKEASSPIWKLLMYMLLCVGILVIVFLIFKKSGPKNERIAVEVQNDWNPETISKTELELKLEASMTKGDYRECVRIYFTFILKELIRKRWIRWKKDKTNHHYVMEMGKQGNVLSFMECVRIYDLVWYGNYKIDEDIFEMLQPTLLNYYKSLDPIDE